MNRNETRVHVDAPEQCL